MLGTKGLFILRLTEILRVSNAIFANDYRNLLVDSARRFQITLIWHILDFVVALKIT